MILPGLEVRFFLLLNRLGIEGRRRVVALLAEGKAAHEIHEQLQTEELNLNFFIGGKEAFNADREIERCLRAGIELLTISDADYPPYLKEIADPPLLLYKKGNILKTDQNALAIVGTRHPSFYGRTQAQRFSQDLSAKGLTIVSGLARGIDQVAHESALQVSYGRTLAVMGCGLDVIYPKENAALYKRISERGAVLSEYPLGTPPLPENFPRRNRILSGLSYGVFVVEAHVRSGSLITAHQALEQGREIFALPGPVDQLTSGGTHRLLKEGACLVESPDDIVEALALRLTMENHFETECSKKTVILNEIKNLAFQFFENLKKTPSGKNRREGDIKKPAVTVPAPEMVFEKSVQDQDDGALPSDSGEESSAIEEVLKEEGPLSQEEILEFTGLEPSQAPSLLLRLELAKKIKRTVDGKFALGA